MAALQLINLYKMSYRNSSDTAKYAAVVGTIALILAAIDFILAVVKHF